MPLLTSLDGLWTQFGLKPNVEQRGASLHADGSLYLPAGPGSGKNCVILWHTVNLITCCDLRLAQIFFVQLNDERSKTECAQIYFRALNINYRHVHGLNASWYDPDPALTHQLAVT